MSAALPVPPKRVGLAQRLRQLRDATLQPQVSTAARERRDLMVLLAALAFVVAPHIAHLPWWATALLVVLWFWRLWLTVAQRPLPGSFAMLPLLLAAAGAVWLEHRTLFGRDAGVTFLLMLLALKLLEMRARRDVYVVIFLAFFILLTQFLFDQGVLVGLMTLAAVLLLFFLLVSVNLAEGDLHARAKLRLVGVVFLKALPLTAALFVLFPRLNAPLWGMPGDGYAGRTGLSTSMTPGAIGRLLESDEIAFRALFGGPVPQSDQLYWRGPVLGNFTGRTWLTGGEAAAVSALDLEPAGAATFAYTITQEPHQRDWLFALELPVDIAGAAEFTPRLRADGQLIAGRLMTERARYSLRSAAGFSYGRSETRLSLQPWLQLPPGYNPRTLELAAELRRTVPGAQDSRDADGALVQAVLRRFRQQDYRYTLEPPPLGRNSVDEFLFDTRAGLCEHYASAFVVLMRALDIPARVVTGYQGGEFNPIDGFLTVRQADAHAWAEVWLAGRGWVRVDPTAAVAPERVARGGRTAAAAAAGAGGPVFGERSFSLLRAIRFQWEALENGWNQWVLSYTPERQRELLRWFGLVPDGRTLALVFALVVSAILVVLGVISLRHRTERDRLGELQVRLRERLADAGVDAPAHLGPRALLAHASPRLDAASAEATRQLVDELERWRYSRASTSLNGAALRALRARLRRYRPRTTP
jgi:transglutaminase-like putative cysteine protease